jgi:hypothetical protein
MALPATEAFTGTGALSGSWTLQKNSVTCATNEGKGGTAGDDNFALWTADTFNNDQYSQVAVGSTYGTDYIELPVRGSGTNNDYLLYWNSTGHITISKYVSGTQTDLQDTLGSGATGDVIKIECTGTSIKAYKNGTQIGTTVTDSSLTSGSAGCGAYGTGSRFDNWEGGNVGGGGGGDPAAKGFRSLLGVGPK